jgi:selenium metabolism protein YedF
MHRFGQCVLVRWHDPKGLSKYAKAYLKKGEINVEFIDDTRRVIDARGGYYPSLLDDVKNRLAQRELPYLVTVVDNPEDRDLVVGVARELNLTYKVYSQESNYYIRIDKEELPSLPKEVGTDFNQVILVTSDSLGRGEHSLGCELMDCFFSELPDSETLPQSMIFVNSGVFLVCEGSIALSELMELEKRNVKIFACDRSLDFYGLKEKLCVGKPIKTFVMVNYLTSAIKVLTLG